MPAECEVFSRFEPEGIVEGAGVVPGSALSETVEEIFLFEEEAENLLILSKGDFSEGGIDLSRSFVPRT